MQALGPGEAAPHLEHRAPLGGLVGSSWTHRSVGWKIILSVHLEIQTTAHCVACAWGVPFSGDFGVQKGKTKVCEAAVTLYLCCDNSCRGDIGSLTQVSSRCWRAARHLLEKLSVCFPHQHVIRFVPRAAAAVLFCVSKSAVPVTIPTWHWAAAATPCPCPLPAQGSHIHTASGEAAGPGDSPALLGRGPQWAETQPCQGHCNELAELRSICVGTGFVCCRYNHTSYWENLPVSLVLMFLCDASWWKGWVGETQVYNGILFTLICTS